MTSTSGATVLGPGEGAAHWFLSNRITVKATAATTGGGYGLFEADIPAGFSPPLHIHHREDETFWVLDGELTVRCGQQTFRAGPGAYVFAPRGVPHTFVVEGARPGRLLTLLTPAGSEAFFAEAGRPATGPGLPPSASLAPALDRLAEIAARFDMEFVGPPLAPSGAGQ
jgi:mannose-6-phosphate isomerase-like protein (cupin superfamily)